MTISRAAFFWILFVIVVSPFLIPKLLWLANSEKANGTMRFVGKSYTGQLIHYYSEISFIAGNDTIWFESKDNTIFPIGATVPVRYQKDNHSDAKVNVFSDIWSEPVIYGGILPLILLVVFFHPQGIPRRAKLYLTGRKPFIRLV